MKFYSLLFLLIAVFCANSFLLGRYEYLERNVTHTKSFESRGYTEQELVENKKKSAEKLTRHLSQLEQQLEADKGIKDTDILFILIVVLMFFINKFIDSKSKLVVYSTSLIFLFFAGYFFDGMSIINLIIISNIIFLCFIKSKNISQQ